LDEIQSSFEDPDAKKASHERLAFENALTSYLDGDDVFGLWAFFTLGNNELNTLSFNQSFETITNDRAEVRENIRTGLLFNKAETFSFVKPLNSTCSCTRHNITLQNLDVKMPFGGWDCLKI